MIEENEMEELMVKISDEIGEFVSEKLQWSENENMTPKEIKTQIWGHAIAYFGLKELLASEEAK